MATSFISILTDLFLIAIGMWILVLAVSSAFFACLSIYKILTKKNRYEITVNEKSFKTSRFKKKMNGSIEFTADDGTIIRASEYEIKKLN